MFVMLLGSIANAQTFDFGCGTGTFESDLEAIFASETAPTELTPLLTAEANRVANITGSSDKQELFTNLSGDGVTVAYGTAGSDEVFTVSSNIDGNAISNNVIANRIINVAATDEAKFRSAFFDVILEKWNQLHPNAGPTVESDLSAIYADGTTPPVLTDLINNTSDAVEASTDSSDFFKSLGADSGYTVASFSADEIGFYFRIDAIDTPKIYSEVGNIDTPASHRAFTLQIVKHIWDLLYPDYVSPEELAALRTTRINELDALDKNGVNVVDSANPNRGDVFIVSYGTEDHYFYADQYGPGLVENKDATQYTNYKNAIIAKRDEIITANTPTVAKELAAWFADTDNAPTGAAPDYLPTALYAHANTLINGTERLNFISNGLLSAHGVTITRGGAGQTGATVTTFILSKGDGYDVTIDWGDYSSNGFNGNSNASPELYRNLVFDVIKTGWKLVNETNNTKRSDWLDQDLDITGNNVELQTYGHPNYDWWIYFNVDGLRIPILSGGVSGDPMFYNKHTVNPHDTYMTEVEFQKLVVFVTYMRDNFDRLKGITGRDARNSEILTMATVEFGATVSPLVSHGDGTYHYTFNKNGNSNMYPVQTNWTHPAGTALETLSPDDFVKLYAKARGILIGL